MDFPSWINKAVAYQVFPDRFDNLGQTNPVMSWGSTPKNEGVMGGTLKGIESRIEYLRNLGINLLYLNPIFLSPSNHRYDAIDYFSIDPILGSMEDFQSMITSLHNMDIRLMMDIAFNHTSNQHPRFQEAIKGDAESRNWYFFKGYDSYEPGWVRAQGYSYEGWWGYAHLPKLNIKHIPLREHHLSVLEHWSNLGVDAYRFDVPNEVGYDPWFWNDVATGTKDKLRIAELWWEQRDWLKLNNMQGQMNYPLLYYMLNFFGYTDIKEDKLYSNGLGDGYFQDFSLKNRDLHVFIESMQRLSAVGFTQDSLESMLMHSNLNLLGSHDTPRIASYLPSLDIRKQLFTLLFFSVGIPCIYYGDETGMKGNADPDNRRAFNWDASTWDIELFDYVRALVDFRRKFPAFQGTYAISSLKGGLIEVKREQGDKKAVAVFNRSREVKEYHVPHDFNELITGNDKLSKGSDILIPEHGVRILKS